jgi:hypothetical protein
MHGLPAEVRSESQHKSQTAAWYQEGLGFKSRHGHHQALTGFPENLKVNPNEHANARHDRFFSPCFLQPSYLV